MDAAQTTIEFEFTASRADGEGREIRVKVTIEDDGRPMVDLEEEAEERAEKIAQKRLGTVDVEIVSW